MKEEKILLVAEMSNDPGDVVAAITQILNNCIIDEVDLDNFAFFDLEFLFLQIRSKSVGNIIEFTIEDYEDGKTVDIEIDLDDIKVDVPEDHSKTIQLDNDVFMDMKYPTVKMLEEIMKFDDKDPEQLTRMIARHIDKVYDSEKIYDLSEETEDQICEWLDSFGLASPAMKSIDAFWATMPRLAHTIHYRNSLGNDRTMELKGLGDFFL